VIDTTGSMGDELEFVKSELRSIVRAVRDRFPRVDQRVALVFYRDEGDAYVTRRFDFTGDLGEVRKNLQAQSAGGGGDKPEAMHKALEDAVSLKWRADGTARVLFLIGDAPPHAKDVGRTVDVVNALRKKGVAVYPVAASGYDTPAEFVLRAAALLTGGQFLFLTDDSGVGDAHAEPHLTDYYVERLDRLMARLIAGELAGKRVPPEPNDIVRTVGHPR
jgi:von Willebrand factor type A domain